MLLADGSVQSVEVLTASPTAVISTVALTKQSTSSAAKADETNWLGSLIMFGVMGALLLYVFLMPSKKDGKSKK